MTPLSTRFRGPWIIAGCFFTFGLASGLPCYIAQQIIVSNWYKQRRGQAMGIAYEDRFVFAGQ